MPNTENRHAAVVYNPAKIARARLKPVIDRCAEESGWASTSWFETSVSDPGEQAAGKALDAGADLVLAAGGDGTIRAVAAVLAESEIPLGILPQGTGNVFARNLGIKVVGLPRMVETAFSGTTRAVDLGEAVLTDTDGTRTTHTFLVATGVGVDAEIMARTTSTEKRLFGWIGYILAGARVLGRTQNATTTIEVAGHPAQRTRAATTLVCNCGYLPGNVLLVPDARIDDGTLDVLSLSPHRLRDWVGILRRIVVEHHLRRTPAGKALIQLAGTRKLRALSYAQGPTVTISLESPREVEVDGDPVGRAVRLECRTLAQALRVQVPRS